jgi:hypothetical protein
LPPDIVVLKQLGSVGSRHCCCQRVCVPTRVDSPWFQPSGSHRLRRAPTRADAPVSDCQIFPASGAVV